MSLNNIINYLPDKIEKNKLINIDYNYYLINNDDGVNLYLYDFISFKEITINKKSIEHISFLLDFNKNNLIKILEYLNIDDSVIILNDDFTLEYDDYRVKIYNWNHLYNYCYDVIFIMNF